MSPQEANLVQRLCTGVYGTNRIALCHEAAENIKRMAAERDEALNTLQDMGAQINALHASDGRLIDKLTKVTAERDALRAELAAAPAPAPGSVANEMREFAAARLPDFHGPYHMALVLSQKINEWADKLAAAPAPHPDTADAERWRHVWQCVRMAQHGEYVLMPDEPTGLPGDSLVRVMFLREVDAAIDAARAQAQGGKP